MRFGRLGIAGPLLAMVIGGCGSWQRVGSDATPDAAVLIPRLFDATTIYAGMGFFAKGEPLPFVASVRYVASPVPDTAFAVFGLSLANSALSFRRSNDAFEAEYRVEVVFRQGGRVVKRIAAEETVRVGSFQETLRADESVIFQQITRLPAGAFRATVSVRDRGGGSFASDERELTVPRFARGSISSLVPIYEGAARASRAELPRFLVNPRATAPYGLDSLVLYLEAYGPLAAATVDIRGVSNVGDTVWSTRSEFERSGDLAVVIVPISPENLPVGELVFSARAAGGAATASAPALISFSDQWVITNFDALLALLRYFGQDQALAELRAAPPEERPELWREFWTATDPNPVTPENEAITRYFRRLQEANIRFQEAGDPGWLTDRGEVFIALGEPDEVFDQSSALQGQRRIIRWNFVGERLQLDFVDETGFGRFRLTPISRSEFQRVRNRIRSRS